VVADGMTGYILRNPRDVDAVADKLKRLFGDTRARNEMGMAARRKVVAEFDYDMLASRLAHALGTSTVQPR